MKKIFIALSIVLLTNASLSIAQTNSKAGAKPKVSKADSTMCTKEWHVTSVTQWGVAAKPDEKTKKDVLKLNLDGTFSLVLFGEAKSGTWKKAGQFIYFTDDATKKQFYYKVMSVEPAKIKVDYLDADEMHTLFEME